MIKYTGYVDTTDDEVQVLFMISEMHSKWDKQTEIQTFLHAEYDWTATHVWHNNSECNKH